MKKASITETKKPVKRPAESSQAEGNRVDHGPRKTRGTDRTRNHRSDEETEGWLRELERAGLVKRPKLHPSKTKLSGPNPKAKDNASIVEALLADRQESR